MNTDDAIIKIYDHPYRWGIGIVILVFLIVVVMSVFGPWASKAKEVTGPQNVSAQYGAVISDWQDLVTQADQACAASKTVSDANSPTFIENPALAYRSLYLRTRADYNSRMQDVFQAKLVGPHGYPRTVPDFPETHAAAGDWCAVAEKLIAIHP